MSHQNFFHKYSNNQIFLNKGRQFKPLSDVMWSLAKHLTSLIIPYIDSVKDIEQRTAFFFCLDQLSITLICVPSYDLSYNVYLFPYWFEIGY